MNNIKKQDLQFGFNNEERMHPILQERFGELINNNIKNKYHPIDFKNNKYGVEYKRRRIKFGQYPTLMVNISKIDKGNKYMRKGKRVFYIWECDDDTYYWELNDNQWNDGRGGTSRRGRDEYVDVAYIENKYIKKLSSLIL
jgi:hypothetical protein